MRPQASPYIACTHFDIMRCTHIRDVAVNRSKTFKVANLAVWPIRSGRAMLPISGVELE